MISRANGLTLTVNSQQHFCRVVAVVSAEKTPGSRAEVGRVSPEISMSGHPMETISAAVKGKGPEKDSSKGQVSPKRYQASGEH